MLESVRLDGLGDRIDEPHMANAFSRVDRKLLPAIDAFGRGRQGLAHPVGCNRDEGVSRQVRNPRATPSGQVRNYAWATFTAHDTYAGIRINMRCQVIDMKGALIPGLYSGGESAAGCSQHGVGRCITQGLIAGKEAANEPS